MLRFFSKKSKVLIGGDDNMIKGEQSFHRIRLLKSLKLRFGFTKIKIA
jgi:hypothetical protein